MEKVEAQGVLGTRGRAEVAERRGETDMEGRLTFCIVLNADTIILRSLHSCGSFSGDGDNIAREESLCTSASVRGGVSSEKREVTDHVGVDFCVTITIRKRRHYTHEHKYTYHKGLEGNFSITTFIRKLNLCMGLCGCCVVAPYSQVSISFRGMNICG